MISHYSIDDAKISRQGFERRVVSQDLQLWLSNVSVSVLDSFFFFDTQTKKTTSLTTNYQLKGEGGLVCQFSYIQRYDMDKKKEEKIL